MHDLSLLQRRYGSRYPNYLLIVLMLGSMAMILASTSVNVCLLYTSPSPRDLSTSRMPSSA